MQPVYESNLPHKLFGRPKRLRAVQAGIDHESLHCLFWFDVRMLALYPAVSCEMREKKFKPGINLPACFVSSGGDAGIEWASSLFSAMTAQLLNINKNT